MCTGAFAIHGRIFCTFCMIPCTRHCCIFTKEGRERRKRLSVSLSRRECVCKSQVQRKSSWRLFHFDWVQMRKAIVDSLNCSTFCAKWMNRASFNWQHNFTLIRHFKSNFFLCSFFPYTVLEGNGNHLIHFKCLLLLFLSLLLFTSLWEKLRLSPS